MNQNTNTIHNRGFTMVELLITLAIFGIVVVGIFSVNLSTQRSANTQEEIVDLQQNLRVGLESITRDLRWAGFLIPGSSPLIPGGSSPIATAAANSIVINTISGSRKVAQIATGFDSPATIATPKTITIKEAINLDANDLVRIVRPGSATQPVPLVLTVDASSSSTSIKIRGFNSAQTFVEGDIIAEYKGASAAGAEDLAPNTVTYQLDADNNLERDGGDDFEDVASNITGLTFSYLMDDGSEDDTAPFPTTLTTPKISDIRAVRVTLTGTVETVDGDKNREMETIVALRNR